VINSMTRHYQDQAVVDLADYRRSNISPFAGHWPGHREFCAAFAAYLRKRAGSAETDSDGLERLAVAFDLRRIRLVSVLTSMLYDQRLIGSAAVALDRAGHLEDTLVAPSRQVSSACAVAYQLADALDAVAVALEIRPPATRIRR
jgi:hypothetical protein